MTKISIKKAALESNKISEDLKIDLRNKQMEQKQPSKKWLFLSIFLFVIIIILAINSWFLYSKKIDFVHLFPEQTIAFSIINQDALYPQVSPFSQFLEQNNFYGQKPINKFNDYLNNVHLDFKSDIQPLFEKQIAFILLSSNAEISFPFALIFKTKASMAQISQILDKIEPGFKNDFNFSSETYRQIEINTLKSFSFSSFNYIYAQAGDYFVVSNSQDCLKDIINNIIDN